MNRQQLLQLSAELDQVIQFDYQDEEDRKKGWNVGGKLATAGATTGALAGGAYLRGRSALNQIEPGMSKQIGVGGTMSAGAGTLVQDAARAGNYAKAAGSEIGNAGKMYGYTRDLGLGKGAAAKGALSGLWGKLKGIKFSSRTESLIQLSAELDQIIELDSPMSDFNRGHRSIMEQLHGKYKESKQAKKDAARKLQEASYGATDAHQALRDKLDQESYVTRGTMTGLGAGALAGTAIGIAAGRRHGTKTLGGVLGGAEGGLLGAYGGMEIGGRIRKEK